MACLTGWVVAVWPKLWTSRYGLLKGVQYLWASALLPRRKTKRPEGAEPRRWAWTCYLLLVALVAGNTAIYAVWHFGGDRWHSLLTALIGMAFGGGLIWTIRIIAGFALQQEAMGFGDVTLMAMIGAFVGWQPAMLIFFIAPMTSIVIAVLQYLLTGDKHIAFGPYLCAGAVILIVAWDRLWAGWLQSIFLAMGGYIPVALLLCLVLMGVLLWVWQKMKEAVYADEE